MTTFQDQPPQSRRAVRASEREEDRARADAQDAPYSFGAVERASDAPPASSSLPHTGRRAQLPDSASGAGEFGPAPTGEPLTYSTQGRVPAPEDSVTNQSLASQPAPGTSDQQSFRVRDFSPEGRRWTNNHPAAQPAPGAQGASVQSPTSSFPAPTRPVELDYHTQGVASVAAHAAQPQHMDDALNHTLTRRELREMRAAAEEQAPPLQEPELRLPEAIDTLLNSGPIEIPTLAPPPGQSQALAEAMAEFDFLTRARREAESRARDAQVASLATPTTPVVAQPVVQASVPVPTHAPVFPEPQASVPAPTQGSTQLVFPPIAPDEAVPVASVPVSSVPVSSVPAPSVPPTASVLPAPSFTRAEAAPSLDDHGGRSSRAPGHWSANFTGEHEDLPLENTLSRTVGSNTSAITTSALVLPSVPQPDGMLGSLNSTGEILITGSINLPSTLGTMGAHPGRIDNADFEDDPLDSQVAAPDSAPVRAIRAISTHTSTRGVIEPPKRFQSNRMLTAVIITASVLAVAVVGLIIFAFVSGEL
jgi:hypothetical protein